MEELGGEKQFIRYLQCRIRKADSLQNVTFMQELIRTQSKLLKAVSFTNAIQ